MIGSAGYTGTWPCRVCGFLVYDDMGGSWDERCAICGSTDWQRARPTELRAMQQEWLAENPTGFPDDVGFEGYPLRAYGWRTIEDGDIVPDPQGRLTFARPDGAWWLSDGEVLTAHVPVDWYDAWSTRHRMYGGVPGEPVLRVEVSGEGDHDIVVPGATDAALIDQLLRVFADRRGVLHEGRDGDVLVEDLFVEEGRGDTWIHCPSVEQFVAELTRADVNRHPAVGVRRGDGSIAWHPHATKSEVLDDECTVLTLVIAGRSERHLFAGPPTGVDRLLAATDDGVLPLWRTGLSLPVACGRSDVDPDTPVRVCEVEATHQDDRTDLHADFRAWVDLVVELAAQSG